MNVPGSLLKDVSHLIEADHKQILAWHALPYNQKPGIREIVIGHDAWQWLALRVQLRRYLNEYPNSSVVKIASIVKLSPTSVSHWLRGTYKGNPANITYKIRRFLEIQGVSIHKAATK